MRSVSDMASLNFRAGQIHLDDGLKGIKSTCYTWSLDRNTLFSDDNIV